MYCALFGVKMGLCKRHIGSGEGQIGSCKGQIVESMDLIYGSEFFSLSVCGCLCLSFCVCVCLFVSLFLSVWMSKRIDLLFDPIVPWLGFGDHRLLPNVKEEREREC